MYFHHLQQIVKLATLQLVTRSHWSLALRLLSGGPIDSVRKKSLLLEIIVKEMVLKKYITPSKSPYGAPILFIAKPDGGLRVVCDYRMLNKLTINNRYPLPRIDELLELLELLYIGGKIIFSSLDLLDGYYQIAITPEDQHKTAFTTPFE